MTATDDVLSAVETAVLGVPGVTEVYRARPTIGSAVAAVKRLANRSTPTRVVLDDDVLRVVIGTDGTLPARQAAHEAHVAAMAVAVEHGLAVSRVDVRVARIG